MSKRPPFDPSPPLLPLRRDPHFSRARRRAAGFLAIAKAAWVLMFLEAFRTGTEPTPTVIFLGVLGLITIFTKAELMGELALAYVDAAARLPSAPPLAEVLRRGGLGIALPFALLVVAFVLRASPAAMGVTVALIGLAQMAFWMLGHSSWTHDEVDQGVLRALLAEQPERAVEALAANPRLSGRALETAALGIAGVAIRKRRPAVLSDLEKVLEGREDPLRDRLLAILRADRRRLDSPAEAAADEARALRLVEPGHPRKLPLALFVATAALEQGDGESALKALRLLHTREVPGAASRLLVNWLVLEAARMAGNDELAANALRHMRLFPRRLAASIQFPDLRPDSRDPYAIWMRKAEKELGEMGRGK